MQRSRSGVRRGKPGWWFLAKGAAVAACYAVTTLMMARALLSLEVPENTAAVVGGLSGLAAALALLWWFRSRTTRRSGEGFKTGPG